MFKSSSTTILVRNDSGIDVLSIDTITAPSKKVAGSNSTPPSLRSSTSCSSVEEVDITGSSWSDWKRRLLPPRGWPAKWFTWLIAIAALCGAIWAILPNSMVPHNSTFGLVITITCCFIAEQLIVKVPTPEGFPPLPPLIASLLMGLALRNIPGIDIAKDIDTEVSSVLREMSLTVILTRAGLEIEPEAMKKVKWAVVRLAFMPCIMEATLIGILSHYLLGFPFEWSFMTGFMIAAVSPAVVVPAIIILQDKAYGVAKGVPSLVMAASGIDDVLAIAGFTVLLGIAIPAGLENDVMDRNSMMLGATNDDNNSLDVVNGTTFAPWNTTTPIPETGAEHIWKDIVGAVIEVIIGIVSGLVLGMFLSVFPASSMKYKDFCRGLLLLSIGLLFVFGTVVWGIPGSGALCALIMSFTASLRWKDEKKPLAHAWHYMWIVFQPILFGLTGALVDVALMDGETVGLGLAALGVALIGRLMMSTFVTFGLNFNLKEKIFVSIAWIPKGTVQAALGSAALEQAKALNRPQEEIHWGEQILVLAVLITLITAPIGGFGIALAGPHLLDSSVGGDYAMGSNNEAYVEDEVSEKKDYLPSACSESKEVAGYHHHSLELMTKDQCLDEIEEEDEMVTDGAEDGSEVDEIKTNVITIL